MQAMSDQPVYLGEFEHLLLLAQLEKFLQAEQAWDQVVLLPTVPLGTLVPLNSFPRSSLSRLLQNALEGRLQQTAQILSQVAEIRCLRGLLTLEQGDTEKAAEHFHETVRITNHVAFDDRAVALRYLELLKRK